MKHFRDVQSWDQSSLHLSNEVIKQREPERLLQVEAIREHATMIAGARLNGDLTTVESIGQAALKLVGEFMEAVDKDKEDGLDLDTARMWKDQVREIAVQAKFDQPPEGGGRSRAGPTHPRERQTAWLLLRRSLSWQPTPWRPRQRRCRTLMRLHYEGSASSWETQKRK
jgi:hypothetical protein